MMYVRVFLRKEEEYGSQRIVGIRVSQFRDEEG